MQWLACVSFFFGGAFFANAIPHWVAGMMGRGFPSPFAKPPGKGLSSPKVNVFWAAFNFLIAYLLLVKVGFFEIQDITHVASAGLGALLISLQLAWTFGKVFGGKA